MTAEQSELNMRGGIFIYGIRTIAKENGVSLEEAAQIARQGVIDTEGTEHLNQINEALEFLTQQEKIDAVEKRRTQE